MLNFFKKNKPETRPEETPSAPEENSSPKTAAPPAQSDSDTAPPLTSVLEGKAEIAPPPADTAADSGPAPAGDVDSLCVEAIKQVYDPEIPINIYEMGLIYEVKPEPSGDVNVRMTLTSPNCPAAEQIPEDVKKYVGMVPGVANVNVEIVWDPPWDPDTMMSEAAKLELGME